MLNRSQATTMTVIAVVVLTLLASCRQPDSTATPVPPTNVPPTTIVEIQPKNTPAPSRIPITMPSGTLFDVPYIENGHARQKLDIYLPESGDRPLPTLLLLHGGEGDKRNRVITVWARRFSDQGYAVVAPNVRDLPQYPYPARPQDTFCAMAWMNVNAETYGFDPERIVTMGISGGAIVAAMLGTVDDRAMYMAECPYPLPETNWLQGVVPFAGVFDLSRWVTESDHIRSYVNNYLGAELDKDPEIWAEASAITWVDGSEPPFLLIHGTADTAIDPVESTNLAAALESVGVYAHVELIPDAEHLPIVSDQQALDAVDAFLAMLAEE
ncbi:MAG: alpha/beta hydrolase [Chloroflexi bacterium]|nr:alpha/beta hydrolase [Chloroflexota bacterium]